MIKTKVSAFQKLALTAGQYYVNSGGPTSRLEDILLRLGNNFGLTLEVFSTTTALFVSVKEKNTSFHDTQIVRTKASSKKLVNLIWIEAALEAVSSGKKTPEWAIERIPKKCGQPIFSTWFQKLCVFLIGFSASYIHGGNLIAAGLAGIITVLISFISGPLLARWKFSGIFAEFFAGTFALLLASILSHFLALPVKSLVIGGLIYLVPGLTITSAVSELAEQNLVSGTAKLMRGILTIMALGCSFFFVTDLFTAFSLSIPVEALQNSEDKIGFFQQMFWSAVSTISFCVVFSVPRRYIFFATLTGLFGWSTLHLLDTPNLFILDSFLPAFLVGATSLLLSRISNIPSQVYSVPGILSLVPGMLALSSFYSTEVFRSGESTVPQIAIVACGLVFGLLSSRIPYLLIRNERLSGEVPSI